MLFKAHKNSESGQILLIVVLAAVVSLTVGLAAVSRTITNTRVSTEEADSQKALAAAEAGIEEQLNKYDIATGTSVPVIFSNSSNYTTASEPIDGTEFDLNNGADVLKDQGADIWLSTYPGFADPKVTTTLTLSWDAQNPCDKEPAIEVVVISGDRTNPSMQRHTADGCQTRQLSNNFTYRASRDMVINVSDGFIARVIPLYNSGKIHVNSTTPLPAQGYVISSTGKSGGTVRQVNVFQGHPMLPIEFFPYNLFIP